MWIQSVRLVEWHLVTMKSIQVNRMSKKQEMEDRHTNACKPNFALHLEKNNQSNLSIDSRSDNIITWNDTELRQD